MKKRVVVFVFVIFLLSLLFFNFVSAFSFADFWNKLTGKITGKVVGEVTESGFICSEGVLGYWNFDDSIEDILGKVSVSKKKMRFDEGKIGQALSLNGKNEFLTIINPGEMDIGSYSFWVKPSLKNAMQGYVYSPSFGISQGSGKLFFQAGISIPRERNEVYISNWQTGEWHHIIMTWNGSNFFGYVDGNLIIEGNQSSPRKGGIMLGVRAVYYLKGAIDEFAIFDKVLSDYEVLELYNNGKGKEVCIPYIPLDLEINNPEDNEQVEALRGETLLEVNTTKDAICSYALYKQVPVGIQLTQMENTGGKNHTQLLTELEDNQNYIVIVECVAEDETIRKQNSFLVRIPVIKGYMGVIVEKDVYEENERIRII